MERFWWGGGGRNDDDGGDDDGDEHRYCCHDYHDDDFSSSGSGFVVADYAQDIESTNHSRMTSSSRPKATATATSAPSAVFDDLSDDVIVFVKDLPRLNSDDDDENDRRCAKGDGDTWAMIPSNPSAVRDDHEGEEDGTGEPVWELESVSSSVWTTSHRTFRDVLLSSVDEEVVDFSHRPLQPNRVVTREKQQKTTKIETSDIFIDDRDDDGLLEDIRDSTKTCRGGKTRHLYNRERKQGGGRNHRHHHQQQLSQKEQRRLHGYIPATDKFGRACHAQRENKKMKNMCRKKMYYY